MNQLEKYIYEHLENDADVYSRTYMRLGVAIGDGKIPPGCYCVGENGTISVHSRLFTELMKGHAIELRGRPGEYFKAIGNREKLVFECDNYRRVPLGDQLITIKEVVE